MPQRGYDLQPRVAASATLGTSEKKFQPQRGCVVFSERNVLGRRNRVAVEDKNCFLYPG